jgi:hypothetical protein
MPEQELRELEIARENYLRGLNDAMTICNEEIASIDGRIPSAHGGAFAKKFAANAIRAVHGRLNTLAKRSA